MKYFIKLNAFILLLGIATFLKASDEPKNFNIQAQNLDKALVELSVQSGSVIVAAQDFVAGISSPKVSGAMKATEVLELLLKGTNLSYSLENEQFIIRQAKNNDDLQVDQDDDENNLEDGVDDNVITVVGQRIIRRNRTDSIEPTLVYDVEFFQRFEPFSLQDMLKRIPGITFNSLIPVTPFSRSDNANTIKFRGIKNEGGQILINGRRVPGISNRNTLDFSSIPADSIKEIRVIRSPTAEIDSQGTGLTINVILKDGSDIPAEQGFNWRASGTYSDGEVGTNLSLSTAGILSDSTNYSANLLYSDLPQVSKTVDTQTNIQDAGPGTENRRLNFERETTSLSAGIYSQFDNGSTLNITSLLQKVDSFSESFSPDNIVITSDFDFVTYTPITTKTIQPERSETNGSEERTSVAAVYELPIADEHLATFELSYDRVDYEEVASENLLLPIDVETNPDSEQTIDRDELKLNAKFDIVITELQTLKLGVAFESAETNEFQRFEIEPSNDFTEEDSINAFINYSITLTDSLALQIGSRYESSDTKISGDFSSLLFDDFGTSSININSQQASDFNQSGNNPSASLRWKISDNQQLRFSLARTVNLPSYFQLSPEINITEFFGELSLSVGSPLLRAQRSDGLDVSYEYDFHKNGNLGLSFFYKKTKDQIISTTFENRNAISAFIPLLDIENAVPGPAQVTQLTIPINSTDDIKFKGGEIDFSIPMEWLNLSALSFSSNISYSEEQDTDGETISRQSTANFTLDHLIESLGLNYGISYNAAKNDKQVEPFVNTTTIIKRGAAVDVFVQQRFSDTLLLRLAVANLLDANNKILTSDPGGIFGGANERQVIQESDPIISLTLRGSF